MITVNDINDSQLDIFAKLTENQLAHYYEPEEGLFLAESLKILQRAINAGYEPVCALIEDRMVEEVQPLFSKFPEVDVYTATFDVLTGITGYHMTGGVLCAMRRRQLPEVADICKGARRIAILEDVVNPTNIGAIFRNAAALGVDGILLSPGSCDPLYKRAIRVSMGTVFQIPWTFFEKRENVWPKEGMTLIKDMGFSPVAMALDDRATTIDNPNLRSQEKIAVLLGSEGYGLKSETLARCDYTVMIPMSNGVDSLNVAAASALAFWELCRK